MIKTDSDERTDGQGFVLVDEAKTPPVVEKMTDENDGLYSKFNSDDKKAGIEKDSTVIDEKEKKNNKKGKCRSET